jgi:hypothetical protein
MRNKTFNNNNVKGSPGALKRVQEEVEPRTPSPPPMEKQPVAGDKVDRLHVDVTLLSIEVKMTVKNRKFDSRDEKHKFTK